MENCQADAWAVCVYVCLCALILRSHGHHQAAMGCHCPLLSFVNCSWPNAATFHRFLYVVTLFHPKLNQSGDEKEHKESNVIITCAVMQVI